MCVCVCTYQMAADAHLEANYLVDFYWELWNFTGLFFHFWGNVWYDVCGNQKMPFIYMSHHKLRIDYFEACKLIAIFLWRTITCYKNLWVSFPVSSYDALVVLQVIHHLAKWRWRNLGSSEVSLYVQPPIVDCSVNYTVWMMQICMTICFCVTETCLIF